jgi:hypothetical protein
VPDRLVIEEDEGEMVGVMLISFAGQVFPTGRWSAVVGPSEKVVKRAKNERKRS